MALSKILRRELTNATVRTTTSFNSTGNYKRPYGKTKVYVGGRGTAGYYSYESYAGTNPSVTGFRASGYEVLVTNYNIPAPAGSIGTNSSYYAGTANASTSYNEYQITTNQSVSTTYSYDNLIRYNTGTPAPFPVYYTNYNAEPNGYRAYTGTVNYSTESFTPAEDYFSYQPASYGNNFSVLGVSFPRGYGGTSQTVSPTYVSLPYSELGTNIVVPGNGARVDISNT